MDDFPQQLLDLFGFFAGGDRRHPLAHITAVPGRGDARHVAARSSGYSAQVAGRSACRSPSPTTSPENTEAALALYREHSSRRGAAAVVRDRRRLGGVRSTDDQAQSLAGPGTLSFLRLRSGPPGPSPPPRGRPPTSTAR